MPSYIYLMVLQQRLMKKCKYISNPKYCNFSTVLLYPPQSLLAQQFLCFAIWEITLKRQTLQMSDRPLSPSPPPTIQLAAQETQNFCFNGWQIPLQHLYYALAHRRNTGERCVSNLFTVLLHVRQPLNLRKYHMLVGEIQAKSLPALQRQQEKNLKQSENKKRWMQKTYVIYQAMCCSQPFDQP